MFAIVRWRREALLTSLRQHARSYFILGAFGVVAFNLLFFYALRSTSADNGALIMATNPLLTTLLAAVFLRERPTVRHLIALPVALLGVAVVIAQGDLSRLVSMHVAIGDILMLAANVSWAMYNVLGRRYLTSGSPLVNTTWVMAIGTVMLFLVAMTSGMQVNGLDENASVALAIMAVGGTVLAYLFWSTGIMRLGAARTSIFLNLVPVFAMLLGMTIGTVPTLAQLVGGALVLGAVTISMLPRRVPVEV